MMKDYDETKENSWMMYLDANNLYGWAMSQALPTGGFEWVSCLNQEVQTLEANASNGYILEVDLEYPEELHDAHNDYPIAPERLEVKKAWMSGYQKNLLKTMYGGTSNEVEKLVPNLYDKTRYVLHYRNLQP